MRTDLCSCLGHLQNGCEAMASSLLVLMPHEQTHGAFSILKQIGKLSPDGTKARAVKNVMKLIANSLSVAKVALTQMAGEARPNKLALLNRQRMVMRGTCSWSALHLQISETSILHWLQSAQVSWLGLCGPETSPWSAGTSFLASIECHADDRQTLFHPFSLVGCQG